MVCLLVWKMCKRDDLWWVCCLLMMTRWIEIDMDIVRAVEGTTTTTTTTGIGVNWGTNTRISLPASSVVEDLLISNHIFDRVRLFDADPLKLQALSAASNSKNRYIAVTLGVPNSYLHSFNSSYKAAETWIHDNVTRYLSTGLQIQYVAVGDDPFLLSYNSRYTPFVLGAASNLQSALLNANLAKRVKLVVPCSYDAFLSDASNLPSRGHFRPDLNTTMFHVLSFLTKHHSPFFVTISPFLSYNNNNNNNNNNLSLDFSLFQHTTAPPLKDTHNNNNTYHNTFDLLYDTLLTALSTIGFPDIDIIVSQIGWPTEGAVNATPAIAQTFINAFINHIRTKSGTPLRPRNPPLETYLFSLLDEDQASIARGNFERHWGIFTFDGQAKYNVDFGQKNKLVNAQNVNYLPSKWCVVNNNRDLSNATAMATEACLNADCTALSPGGSCFNISWPGNVSYAFNSFYQLHDQSADSCNFGGLGLITTVDPSVDNCRFTVELQTSYSPSILDKLHFIIAAFIIVSCLLSNC